MWELKGEKISSTKREQSATPKQLEVLAGGPYHLKTCPVLRGGRLRSQLWRDYYWHETCIRGSVPLVCLTGLDGDPTNPTFSKQS